MSAVRWYAFVTLGVLAFSIAGVVRWRTSLPVIVPQPVTLGSAPAASTDSLDDELAAAEDLTVTNDPFRLANAPARVRFDPSNEPGAIGASPVSALPIRPTMVLKAIVGGPPWQAVVDGIPGQPPGTVVRSGASFDKLVARAVTRDSVVIQGPDTTWVLGFGRRP